MCYSNTFLHVPTSCRIWKYVWWLAKSKSVVAICLISFWVHMNTLSVKMLIKWSPITSTIEPRMVSIFCMYSPFWHTCNFFVFVLRSTPSLIQLKYRCSYHCRVWYSTSTLCCDSVDVHNTYKGEGDPKRGGWKRWNLLQSLTFYFKLNSTFYWAKDFELV